MIGDSPISFSENNIHVGFLNFPKSKGLLELLFKKVPEGPVISTDDQRNYGKIINATNAYKKHYKPFHCIKMIGLGRVLNSMIPKFKQIIFKINK